MTGRARHWPRSGGWSWGWVVALVLLAAMGAAAGEDEVQTLLGHCHLATSPQVRPGQALSPELARELWRGLVDSPVTPGSFAPRTVLASLVSEALATGQPLSYEQWLERTRRFVPLVVVSPDGYVRTALTGRAFARLGTLHLQRGELYVQRLRVGAFYFDEGHVFYAVDASLRRQGPPLGECPLGRDVFTAFELGAEQALEDMARGVAALLTRRMLTLGDLEQLPVAVGGLIAHSPEYFVRYVDLPWEEQVREAGRLVTHLLVLRGGAELAGPRVAQASRMPVVGVTAEGGLVLREVVVPAGAVTVVVGAGAATASLVLMSAGGGSEEQRPEAREWKPPSGGPGQWMRKRESMMPEAQRYQTQVTGAPEGWVYRVSTGPGPRDFVDFDGFKDGVLLEVKGPGYKELIRRMKGKPWFEGMDKMLVQARKQSAVAKDIPIQWRFAEKEVAELVRNLFREENFDNIKVIHTEMSP